MKIVALVRIVAPDPKGETVVLKPQQTGDVRDKEAKALIRDGWAEKPGAAEERAKAKAAGRKSPSGGGRRSSTARPGAPADRTNRSRAAMLGDELNGAPRNVDEEE